MRFEKFLLDNYITTPEGQESYRFFEKYFYYLESGDPENKIKKFINKLLYKEYFEEQDEFQKIEQDQETKEKLNDRLYENNIAEKAKYTFEDFEKYFEDLISDIVEKDKVSYREILSELPIESLYIFYDCYYFSFPYLYPGHFNILQEIFEEFEIYLPPIPGRNQHQARCFYYVELCRSLYDFKIKNNLTNVELNVFLYSFARKFVKGIIKNELPEPNKVWIIGASEGDTEYTLPNLESNSLTYWMGNKNMRLGDMVFIYERSPVKKIRYIMRAVSEFYDDPFNYYAGKIWLDHPQRIPAISFAELRIDKIMSQNGLVKAHMQGVGLAPSLTRNEYEAILSILRKKGFDTSTLPILMSYTVATDTDINNEQDVEQQLLEPFLAQLGVADRHITRQMPLRMGRGIRYYPDYVINAKITRGEEQGAFVWEAKYRIANNVHMLEALHQAKSYALRLSASGLGLASYEGIWLSFAKDRFSPERIEHFSWQALTNADTFAHVSSLLKKGFGRL